MDSGIEGKSMEWVRRVGEYRTLIGKRDALGYSLSDRDLGRLEELEQFFTACADPHRVPFIQRDQVRATVSVVVTFTDGRVGSGHGQVSDLSGQGAFIETTHPLPVGAQTVIRIIDRFTGDEWRFGAEVVRHDSTKKHGMGLRFVGIPVSLRLGHRGTPSSDEKVAA
jgi:hypothetical protein